MTFNIPARRKKRVVIVGGGFGGLNLARKLRRSDFQVVLIDRHNFHQFQPMLYQVASAGVEPSSILFPFRKIFQKHDDFHFRLAELKEILPTENKIRTDVDILEYDYLVLATGTKTNYFGNREIESRSLGMKSAQDALAIRNALLRNFEKAVYCGDSRQRRALLNIVVVGGGATGVEVSGILAEMKKFVMARDYPDMDTREMEIYLVEGSPKLLGGMSEKASRAAEEYLTRMGVKVLTGKRVTAYKDDTVLTEDGTAIPSKTLLWVSGVTAEAFPGIDPDSLQKGNRIIVDEFNRVKGYESLFAIGDIAFLPEKKYPHGHPQVAQAAIQQGRLLARNLLRMEKGDRLQPFRYRDKGTLATVGKNKAVADIGKLRMKGFFAWGIWLCVHLMYILGVKNRFFIFVDWVGNYFSNNSALRLILTSGEPPADASTNKKKNGIGAKVSGPENRGGGPSGPEPSGSNEASGRETVASEEVAG